MRFCSCEIVLRAPEVTAEAVETPLNVLLAASLSAIEQVQLDLMFQRLTSVPQPESLELSVEMSLNLT